MKPSGGTSLGQYLSEARAVMGLSLAAVAKAAQISPAYQKKLEADEVKQPSPNILHKQAQALSVPYVALMRLAGYVLPDGTADSNISAFDHALSSADLSGEERKAVAAFIDYLRQQRTGKPTPP